MDAPKVSVVMSVYNGEKYLKEAVDSVLNQTFRDFEFIIINDGSTDSTADILRGYNDGRMKIIYQANIGLTKSLNKGIALAKGEYIARQDADDVSLPNRLEKQTQIIESRPDIFLVTSWYLIMDADEHESFRCIIPSEDKLKKLIKHENMICHGSVMFRKYEFMEMGNYNENFRYGQDKELWLRMFSKGYKFLIIPEPLYKYRITPNNISLKKLKEAGSKKNTDFVCRDKMHKFWLASLFLQQGEPEKARLILVKLLKKYFPGELRHWLYYLLTFCPISIQTIFMWEIRIWIKSLLNQFRK